MQLSREWHQDFRIYPWIMHEFYHDFGWKNKKMHFFWSIHWNFEAIHSQTLKALDFYSDFFFSSLNLIMAFNGIYWLVENFTFVCTVFLLLEHFLIFILKSMGEISRRTIKGFIFTWTFLIMCFFFFLFGETF